MKKALLVVTLAGTFLAANAQTNVAVWGRIVAGVDYESNVVKADGTQGSLVRMATNQWGTSLFGFKGTEELGGGLKTIFLLESGFSPAKGISNDPDAFWSRRTYVGLSSDRAGTLKLGKDLSISNDVSLLDPTTQQWMGTATLVRGRNWQISNNMISYETPVWGGFSAAGQTSLGEVPGSTTDLRKDGISLAYVSGKYELRAIYDVARDINGRYSDLFLKSKELTLGGTLTLERLKLFLAYERLSAPDAPPGAPDRAHHYWIGMNYQLTPVILLIGSAFRVNVNNGGGNANLFMLGTNYSLSTRTLLYASIGTVRNSGNANFSVETDNNPLPGQNQTGAYFGISHTF